MIYPSTTAQGFINIMSDIEALIEKLQKQYGKVYDNQDIDSLGTGYGSFSDAQMQLSGAYDAVATLLSEILTAKE